MSAGSMPTSVVLMCTPSASSTTANNCGISSVNSGSVGTRATVKLYSVAAPLTLRHCRLREPQCGQWVRGKKIQWSWSHC